MDKQIKFLLSVIVWMIGAAIYTLSAYYVWKMNSDSWLFLMLLFWMAISGFCWIYFIYKLGERIKSLN